MKSVIIIYEGVADLPVGDLEGRTPLQVARCDHANRLAELGQCGLLAPVREGLDGRNEALLALLCGVAPDVVGKLHRGPLEAAAVDGAQPYTHAYRGNFVTLHDGVMSESLVATLSEEETRSLAGSLQEVFSKDEAQFHVTGNGRLAITIGRGEDPMAMGHPPCLMEGAPVQSYLPGGKEGEWLRDLYERSLEVLVSHPVNEVRVDLGENPANALWAWGGGPAIPAGRVEMGKYAAGVLLSQSRLGEGVAGVCGIDYINLELNWKDAQDQAVFRVAPLVEALQKNDVLCVYIEAPFELGRYGTSSEKVRALERLDQYLLGPFLDVLEAYRPYRVLMVSDGVVSSEDQHPTTGNVPVIISGEGLNPDEAHRWDEQACTLGSLGVVKPAEALDLFMKDLM